MTGIDKIIEQIGADAAETAQVMIDEAKNDAREEKSSAMEKAAEQCAQIRGQSEKDVAAALDRAKSVALLKKSKLILSAKQKLIAEIIAAAHRSLLELPDDEYFAMVLKMIKKYVLPQKGEIHFSPADYQRLPTDFEQAVNGLLSNTNGALTISTRTRSIDGGFVLVYGDVEVNCSFAALFDAAKERLWDRVNDELFG